MTPVSWSDERGERWRGLLDEVAPRRGAFLNAVAARALPLWLPLLVLGCAWPSLQRPRLAYTPEEFRAELARRVPELRPGDIAAPFEVSDEAIALAWEAVRRAERGEPRVRALVETLSNEPPRGFGLRYDWDTTRTASETLALGRGNCMSFASVLVGLGRGLGWPTYYGEVRALEPELRIESGLAVRLDHMVVLITSKTVRVLVDFSGPLERAYTVRVIDDLTAYAHVINNHASELVLAAGPRPSSHVWERALERFSLAARIEPAFARAWNNGGVALTRLGRLDEARGAYARAAELDAKDEAPMHNLMLLETRALGEVTIHEDVGREAP